MTTPVNVPVEIAEGFYNIRGDFRVAGLINVGTQMSLIRLSSGKYLIIDTISMCDELKIAIDKLTANGTNIEAVLATHPFHTGSFSDFYKTYPNAPYYGTPRHMKKITDVQWKGEINDCNVRGLWSPEVEMRIPEGAEFINPAESNHFSCVFVYHRASRTIHVDDTIGFAEDPNFVMKIFGVKKGGMMFHPTIKFNGLLPHPDSPFAFRDWLKKVCEDWDFDNLVAAHNGVKKGGAKEQIIQLINDSEPLFQKLHEKKKKSGSSTEESSPHAITNNECG
ncbi:hydroxyacylglutathione hydrolase [Acrasis kona]|uniref:Hydroxyacylglutathione hydrolase n=1 Tax=Acrasis kona TaxID=1008807 RepID=A0AAW2YYL2_9EUKA